MESIFYFKLPNWTPPSVTDSEVRYGNFNSWNDPTFIFSKVNLWFLFRSLIIGLESLFNSIHFLIYLFLNFFYVIFDFFNWLFCWFNTWFFIRNLFNFSIWFIVFSATFFFFSCKYNIFFTITLSRCLHWTQSRDPWSAEPCWTSFLSKWL